VIAATDDELRSCAEVDALRAFIREALIELEKVHPRLFQTVDGETVDVSSSRLSGKQVLERFWGTSVDRETVEALEEKRLRHLLEARFVQFLLTSEGRDFLESLFRQQLEAAELGI
jgi:hypothetical protein